jgi:cell division protein FtsL
MAGNAKKTLQEAANEIRVNEKTNINISLTVLLLVAGGIIGAVAWVTSVNKDINQIPNAITKLERVEKRLGAIENHLGVSTAVWYWPVENSEDACILLPN